MKEGGFANVARCCAACTVDKGVKEEAMPGY